MAISRDPNSAIRSSWVCPSHIQSGSNEIHPFRANRAAYVWEWLFYGTFRAISSPAEPPFWQFRGVQMVPTDTPECVVTKSNQYPTISSHLKPLGSHLARYTRFMALSLTSPISVHYCVHMCFGNSYCEHIFKCIRVT